VTHMELKTMNNESEFLPMTEEELDKRHQAVNEVAFKQLPMLLADLDEAVNDKELLDQYETDFLGDLYARMIVAAYMGFCPDLMGVDAVEGKNRLVKLAQEHEDDAENKVDIVRWAIKNLDTGNLVANKFGRTMWKTKPTNAISTVAWKAKAFYDKETNLCPIKIRITEVEDD
jgi:hypothetical protein